MKAVRGFITSHPRSVAICSLAFLAGFTTSYKAHAAEDTSAKTLQKPHAERVSEAYALSVHGGKLIRLPEAATNVFVADPDVADVQVPSPTSIYILGKKSGHTNLYALNQAGDPDSRRQHLGHLRFQARSMRCSIRKCRTARLAFTPFPAASFSMAKEARKPMCSTRSSLHRASSVPATK